MFVVSIYLLKTFEIVSGKLVAMTAFQMFFFEFQTLNNSMMIY